MPWTFPPRSSKLQTNLQTNLLDKVCLDSCLTNLFKNADARAAKIVQNADKPCLPKLQTKFVYSRQGLSILELALQPHAHADDYGHGVHSDVQLGTYDESNSGTYGHVHDPACEPSAAYYDPGGYGDNSYGADDYSTVGSYDGGTGGGYDWDGYNGGYDDGGDDGDYGGDY